VITPGEWNQIYEEIRKGQGTNEVTYGKVIKRDTVNNLIWLAEFSDQPIPIATFNAHVKYSDDTGLGTKSRTAKVIIDLPAIGDTAIVLRQFGEQRLPRCVGVIMSTNYVIDD
jgi:hypothetical protein